MTSHCSIEKQQNFNLIHYLQVPKF